MTNTNTGFSARLLPLLSDSDNSVISPYGIAAVLSMAAEGANKAGLREILRSMGYLEQSDLRAYVLGEINNRCEAFKNENSVTVSGNSEEMHILDEYRQIMSQQYSAEIKEENSGFPSVALKNIASFKAQWLLTTERSAYHDTAFRNADGTRSYPAFLSCKSELKLYKSGDYGDRDLVRAVALPYKLNGTAVPYEMVLVSSREKLTEYSLGRALSNMEKQKCTAEFPEFSIKSEHNLVPMMKNIGMTEIFDREASCFDRITEKPLYASAFIQNAEIDVDKDGTVAKAETCLTLCLKGGISYREEHIVFNEPFSYFLRNSETGDILFMGKVNRLGDCEKEKPTASVLTSRTGSLRRNCVGCLEDKWKCEIRS